MNREVCTFFRESFPLSTLDSTFVQVREVLPKCNTTLITSSTHQHLTRIQLDRMSRLHHVMHLILPSRSVSFDWAQRINSRSAVGCPTHDLRYGWVTRDTQSLPASFKLHEAHFHNPRPLGSRSTRLADGHANKRDKSRS